MARFERSGSEELLTTTVEVLDYFTTAIRVWLTCWSAATAATFNLISTNSS